MSSTETTADERAPEPAGDGAILEAESITKQFGGLTAVSDVNFRVPQRAIVSIIGPNGAGKTTFFNMLTGFYKPTIGKITFDGSNITGTRPDLIMKAGMARTFQNIRLFGTMSAEENVMVGGNARMKAGLFGSILRTPRVRKEEKAAREKAREELAYVGVLRSEGATARRADGRHEPAGIGRADRVHAQAARRARRHRRADRARHEGDHGGLGAHHGARPRREDLRGPACGGPQ
jgi:branched-chain amino acid transport system ATP-binding protein